MNVSTSVSDYQSVVDTSYKKLVEKLQSLGYEVMSPTELAQKSATYAAIKPNGVFGFSPTSGQELSVVSLQDSRYIHAIKPTFYSSSNKSSN